MSYNSVVKSNDANAIEKLTENVNHLEERLKYMQSVNDYYSEHKTMKGFPEMDEETVTKLNERVSDEHRTPYPGKFFTDNRDTIEKQKANIDRIKNNPETVFKGWEFDGGEAIVNLANNKLQLSFDEKPSEERLSVLKRAGFKGGVRSGKWQRPLTRKVFAACDKIHFISPKGGKKPTDLQPKAPKKDEPER